KAGVAAGTGDATRPHGLPLLRGMVTEPGRYLYAVVRLLQPEHAGDAGDSDRPRQLHRAGAVRRSAAHRLPTPAGARGFRGDDPRRDGGPGRGLDDPIPRTDPIRPGQGDVGAVPA